MAKVEWNGWIEGRHEVAEVFHDNERVDLNFQKPVKLHIKETQHLHVHNLPQHSKHIYEQEQNVN